MDIKQYKELVKTSGKRYDQHNVKVETFTGLNEPFIQSIPEIYDNHLRNTER